MKKLSFAITFSVVFSGLLAQESMVSSGGEATGNEGSASYSIGQVSYSTHSGTSGSVSEGIQQAYEISVVRGVDETAIDLRYSAYPNPVTDRLILKIEDGTLNEQDHWMVSFFDINGAVLKQQIIVANETELDMTALKAATYILKIQNDKKEVKTFKIVKQQ